MHPASAMDLGWDTAALIMVASGVASAVALLFVDAPYGKYAPDKSSCQSI
jgi:hypothetical protein